MNIVVIFVGYVGWVEESDIEIAKKICAHCTNKIAIKGKDDIATQEPWMIPFFQEKDKHLIYECKRTSNKRIYPICPYCGKVKEKLVAIYTIYKNHSIGCPTCSDGVSYSEKFIMELFCQLHISIIFHPTVKEIPWAKPHIYDFYDSDRKVIIEVNGIQHYEEVKVFRKSLKETQENDRIKKEKVIKNKQTYIELDCRYSKMEYIKKSLMNNKEFCKRYQLDHIDWEKCNEEAMKSMYIKIYHYKQEHPNCTNIEMAKKFSVNRETIRKALNRMQ